ncbi:MULTISPECIES: cyclase family protein [unclassified Paenibacillus]|uniref:cyclase family protein n=1 Tax=unclassified Paenibacillus TaxID=185978 RepID=UPI001AE87276|nr:MULTISPECIES: cyclase family protein [unclassified Paenibacillus]MBP1155890.1 kynurenine formamidase [Paenibacillus sp. PvP091]MBP1168724.1 kynurenine formamidase [Paenibacillus sp. PvR098]MBP2439752.1 kynurenine formamidase [Paenibacillus sp. PvP052]
MRVIDLSEPIFHRMPVYPGDPEVKVEVIHSYEKQSWELRQLTLGTHTGTHVDAFSHMHRQGKAIDEIPIERFFGTSQVVSLFSEWPVNKGLFFKEEIGMEWFERIHQSSPTFVGGKITEDLERALLGIGIITYTNLVHLELLPLGKDFMFYGFPLHIKQGDGSPVRAVAVLDT